MRSVELFTGAGGLALGISRAGFNHEALLESDHDACETIRQNQRQGIWPVTEWPLHERGVATFDYGQIPRDIDLLAGGVPCQPWSLGGKHRGHDDHRNLFPEMIRATRELRPRAVLIENVKGLLRESFARYYEYILLQLAHPEAVSRANEAWEEHHFRLRGHHERPPRDELSYRVAFCSLNAADYGVPQRRERVFIVAFRSDLDTLWTFPKPTHSLDSLLWTQWVTGEYWERHEVASGARPEQPLRLRARIRQLRSSLFAPMEMPWGTVRDAIADLPQPVADRDAVGILNHRLIPGARSYFGHTGSPLDEPAKTLKAGDHGVPGGENTLVSADRTVRYFTVRESARLQTFPDEYIFNGSWSEIMRQLGNAVPITLASVVASRIKLPLTGDMAA